MSLACADGDVCDFSGERGAERQVQRRNESAKRGQVIGKKQSQKSGFEPRSADPEANSLAVAAIHTYIHHTYERAVIAGCYARKAFAKCARLEQSS